MVGFPLKPKETRDGAFHSTDRVKWRNPVSYLLKYITYQIYAMFKQNAILN
jgi:hypothetical protein